MALSLRAICSGDQRRWIKADCSDLFSHLKIDLPTAQLAAASAVLADLKLI